MKRLTFNQVFDILCITALFGLLVFAASNGVSLALTLEQWDTVATAGWALLPTAVIFLLVALGKLTLAARDTLKSELEVTSAKAALLRKEEEVADANLWNLRDMNKRERDYHKARGHN